ncbi:4559_t:CDS:2, partial [Scutellospora calospora]
DGFLKDQLNRPQIFLYSLLVNIQLFDIVEVWELFGITKSYKYYVICLNDSEYIYTCLSIINRGLYLEDIQDQDNQLKLQETIGVLIQFQQNNNVEMMNDLYLFNKFRPQCAFIKKTDEDDTDENSDDVSNSDKSFIMNKNIVK